MIELRFLEGRVWKGREGMFLKLWPSKADGLIMFQSCPLSKEKTHTHLQRGVSLPGTLPLLARVWLLLFKLSSVLLMFTFMQQWSEIFFKGVGTALDAVLTALSLAKSETLESPLRSAKKMPWYHVSLQTSLTQTEVIYCLLITHTNKKSLTQVGNNKKLI